MRLGSSLAEIPDCGGITELDVVGVDVGRGVVVTDLTAGLDVGVALTVGMGEDIAPGVELGSVRISILLRYVG